MAHQRIISPRIQIKKQQEEQSIPYIPPVSGNSVVGHRILNVKVHPEFADLLDFVAKTQGVSRSDYIRNTLYQAVSRDARKYFNLRNKRIISIEID